MTNFTIDQFGRNHWLLLQYVECLGGREIDPRKMRCNPNTHPQFVDGHLPWAPQYGTRLRDPSKGGFASELNHDDWDCLSDLVVAGFVEPVLGMMVTLTRTGHDVLEQIRQWRRDGGESLDDFTPAVLKMSAPVQPHEVVPYVCVVRGTLRCWVKEDVYAAQQITERTPDLKLIRLSDMVVQDMKLVKSRYTF